MPNGRFKIRCEEMMESLKIVEQIRDELAASTGEPYRVSDGNGRPVGVLFRPGRRFIEDRKSVV